MLLDKKQKKETWKLINYRNVKDMITAEFLHDLYNQTVVELNPVHFQNTICIVENNMFKSFAPQDEWDSLAETLGEKLLHDKKLREKFSKYLERPQTDLHTLIKALEKKYNSASSQINDKEMYNDLQQLHYLALDRIYAINLVQFEHAFSYCLNTLATKENVEISKVLHSSETTISTQEQIAALELSIKVSTKKLSLETAIKIYNKQFSGAQMAYGAQQELNHSPEERIITLINSPLKTRQQQLQEIKKTISKKETLHLSPQLKEISELAKKTGERRDQNKAIMGKVAQVRSSIIKNISSKSNVRESELNSYFLQDFFNLLYKKQKLANQTISLRQQRLILSRKENIIYGNNAINISEHLLDTHTNKQPFISGITASSGIVKGKVRRVLTIEDAKNIKPDEILVAYGTDFDLMIGLQNCAGIITEEGGLLSHASVISRELGKPCLINVKNAMNILQDGQEIEIDTNKNHVHILNAQKNKKGNTITGIIHLSDSRALDINAPKSRNLHLLEKNNIPTLTGFIVDTKNEKKHALAENIIDLLNAKGLSPLSLIIRSNSMLEDNSNSSMAGQFESIVCTTEKTAISKAINDVIASYLKPKIDSLKNRTTESDDYVFVQPYYPHKWGGVAFSNHPITKEKTVYIEASCNGAAAIVSGMKADNNLPQHIKDQVTETVLKIEKILGYPVDVEWGYGSEGLKIFQARPIITNNKKLIIIAGGEGSRIKEMFNKKASPFTKHFLPLPESGTSIIGSIINKAQPHFRNIEISASHNTIDFMMGNFKESQNIHISNDNEMIGPLAPPLLELISQGKRVYACCGDIYSNFNWDEFEKFHDTHNNPISILSANSFPAKKAACFNIASNGSVKSWKRKIKSSKKDYINIGAYIIDPDPELIEIAKELLKNKACKEDVFFQKCIEKRILSAYKETSFSCNINTPDIYNRLVKRIIKNNRKP